MQDNLHSVKNNLRDKFKNIRASIIDRENKDDKLFDRLVLIPQFQNAKTILIYISFGNEASTRQIVEYCWANNKSVYSPFYKTLDIGKLTCWEDCNILNNGYFEPRVKTPEYTIELSIVPGLAFDTCGNRLGTGNGWYDRFFIQFGPQYLCKVGLAYDEQISSEVPVNSDDVKMDYIITPSKVYATS